MFLNCVAKWTPCEAPHTLVWLCCLYFWHLLCILYFLVEISEAVHIPPILSEMQLQGTPSTTHTPSGFWCTAAWTDICCVWWGVNACLNDSLLRSAFMVPFSKITCKDSLNLRGLLERGTGPKTVMNHYYTHRQESHLHIVFFVFVWVTISCVRDAC